MNYLKKIFEYLVQGVSLLLFAGFCIWSAKKTFIVDPETYNKPRFKNLDEYLSDVATGEMGRALAKSYVDRRPASVKEDKDLVYKVYHSCLMTEATSMRFSMDDILSKEVTFEQLNDLKAEFEKLCNVE